MGKQKKLQLKLTDRNGKTKLMNAKQGVTIEEVEEIMENEVYGGYAVYAAVIVDGEIYSELEV